MSYRKGKSFKEILVWAKLWRTDNFLYSKCKSHVLQLSRRQFLNLVTWDASKFDSMLSWSDQGSPRRPKGIVMYAIFPVPPSSLVMTQVKEKPENYLLVDISLLPTFHFLPPPYIFVPISPSSLLFRAISLSSLLCTFPHLFCTEWSPWIMGNVSLKVLEKSFNFVFKKGYETWDYNLVLNKTYCNDNGMLWRRLLSGKCDVKIHEVMVKNA